MQNHSIVWPQNLNPETHPVRVYNELFIPASPEKIWEILIDAKNWPTWYKNSRQVKILDNNLARLELGAEFEWITFSLKVKSKVLIYNPPFDLGWSAKEFGARGFHGWKLIPKDNGTLIITEEVQTGWGARILKPFIKMGLKYWHQKWLEGIETRLSANASN